MTIFGDRPIPRTTATREQQLDRLRRLGVTSVVDLATIGLTWTTEGPLTRGEGLIRDDQWWSAREKGETG